MPAEPGQTLSHYRLIKKIGEGGMGVVWKAEDVTLRRPVALKILPSEVASDASRRDRFFREARSASAINHPNIAQVYELGQQAGVHFIAMEFVEGKTLRQLASHKKLPLDRLLDVMIQVTDALAKAHHRGIVHRDLKPENLMINEDGLAKVLDFGLAKLIARPVAEGQCSQATTETALHTRPGTVMGTPHYMSPEQAKGEPTDHRSDTFSLGAVMYEMACGRRPFEGSSDAEVLSAILRETPPPISELNEQVPSQLQRVIHKALAKRRDDRYQDIKDLWVDLREIRRQWEADSAPEIATPGRVQRKRLSRRGWLYAVGAAVLVLGLLASIYGLYRGRTPVGSTERLSMAVFWFENLSGSDEQDYFAAGMTEELINELWKMSGLRVSTWDDIQPLKGATLTAQQVGQRLGYDYVLTGTIRRAANQIRVTPRLVDVAAGEQVWTAQFDDVLDNVFALQDSIALQVASQLRVTLTRDERRDVADSPTRSQAAYDHYLKGRYFYYHVTFEDNERAVTEYQKALQIDPGYALAMAGLADAYVQRYRERYDYDEQWLDEAKRLIDTSLGLDPDLGEAYESRAELLLEERNLLEALGAAETARDLRPDWDEPYVRLAEIRFERGERTKALELFERALTLRPSIDALCGRGKILQGRGDYEAAERDYRAALDIQADHVRPYLELGDLYNRDLRLPDKAESFYRQAITVRPDHPGGYTGLFFILGTRAENYDEAETLARGFVERFPYHWNAYELLFEFLAWWRGDYPAALAVIDEAVLRNPDQVWPHLFRAHSYAFGMDKNPEPEKAGKALERALALRPNSPRVLEVAGDTYAERGDQERALEYYLRGLEINPGSVILLHSIARSYSLRANFEKTTEYALRAIEQEPGIRSWTYFLLWNALEQLGRSEEMVPMLERAAREFGRDEPRFSALLGAYQRCAGRYVEALETYRQAFALKESESLLIGLAKTQFLVGDVEGALESLELSRTNIHQTIVRMLTWQGDFDKVEPYLQRIRDGMPQQYSGIDAWESTAGSYYARMRRFDDAIAVATEARDSGHTTYTEYLNTSEATWHRQKGDMKRAVELLDEMLDSTSLEARVLVWTELALLEAARGNLERALDLVVLRFERNIDRWESDPAAELLVRLYHAMGRRDDARRMIREIRGPRSEHLMTVWAQGWLARALYRRAQFEVLERSRDSKYHLERALRFLTIAVRNSVHQPAGIDMAYRSLTLARMGRSEEAIKEIQRSLRAEPQSAEVAYHAACVFSMVGDNDRALHWVQTAIERGHQELWWARVDPDLDPLRSHPRFEQVMSDWDARLRTLFE
jgi:non-specific serine/threonine protein kinase